MGTTHTSVRLVLIGWLLVAVFGLLLLGTEPASAAMFIVVGLAMAAWVRWRPGAPALVVSLVLGLLHTVEQAAYLIADFGDDPISAWHVLGDTEGLVAGLLVVGGSSTALVRSRQSQAGAGRRAAGQGAVG
jgi:hypothetical protein